MYLMLADLVVLLHLSFILFVLFGGLASRKWPRAFWLHLPAVLWGTIVELAGWVCPLTPLEHWLRAQGGSSGHGGDFVLRYLLPILYPEALTRDIQVLLGTLVVTINVVIYGWMWQTRPKS
jgi:hypothetical protein